MIQFGEVRKNSVELIRVIGTEYKGHQFVDVRVYYESEDGEYKPSKKGIALSSETIEPVIELLKDGAKALKEGLEMNQGTEANS